MYIKYKCGKRICFEMVDKVETWTENHYDEHAAMHYDCDGWTKTTYTRYIINECPVCGKRHRLSPDELIRKPKSK